MQNIWTTISHLGINGENGQTNRSNVLSNQINFVSLVLMILLFLITSLTLLFMHEDMSYGTLRIPVLLVVCLLNLVAARFGFVRLSKLSLIFLPPVVFLLGPTFIGYVEEESYTYYPYFIIASSILPQLLLNPRKEKFLYWISVGYYLLLTIFIDKIMLRFGDTYFPIVDRINTFYAFYKIAQVTIFFFINAGIFYLRNMNYHYEEQLNSRNRDLDLQNATLKEQKERIEQQKDELVSKEISTWQKLIKILSHEIVNSAIPITNLAGMTRQMLEDETGNLLESGKITEETIEDIHQGLKIIESRTQAMINFVKATKSLTQIPKPNKRRFLVRELVDQVTLLFRSKLRDAGIHLDKQIIPADLSAEADPELIEQVIINLIHNALEAMEKTAEPQLSIIASQHGSGKVQISVSDNGTGISKEVIEKIFLPFYSTKINKSGIGLSLSQQIMLLHDGRLEVSSDENEGATFKMIF